MRVSHISAVTFNMQNAQRWGGAASRDAISIEQTVGFLESLNADILFLQEVEQGFDGGYQIEPPPHFEFLRKRFSNHSAFFAYPPKNTLELPFGLGLAIFSRWPIMKTQEIILPAADVAFDFGGTKRLPSKRLLLRAEIEVNGCLIRLLNAHLQAFFMIHSSSDEHLEQRNRVAEELRNSELPTLMGGDFNCTPEESTIAQFEQLGFRSVQKTKVTWKRMPFVLDHLLYSDAFRVESYEVVPTSCSDHHAIKATFSMRSL